MALTRLTVALNRRRAYAAEHPMVQRAEAEAYEALTAYVARRGALTLGIAADAILIDGAPADAPPAITRELADRLHRRGVGGLAFDAALTPAGLREALAWLAAGERGGTESAASDVDARPPAPDGVRIGRIAYDHLVLGDDARDTDAMLRDIWSALASAAFAFGDVLDEDSAEQRAGVAQRARETPEGASSDNRPAATPSVAGTPSGPDAGAPGSDHASDAAHDPVAPPPPDPDASPDAIARAIDRRAQRAPYARDTALVLLALARQVAAAPPAVRETLAGRLRDVLLQLETRSVESLVRAVGTGREQKQFLVSMISALPADALVQWLETSADVTAQPMSHHLTRLLTKLARLDARRGATPSRTATTDVGPDAPALRRAASDLVRGWRLDVADDAPHDRALDHIALRETVATNDRFATVEASRIVQMACELDDATPAAIAAAESLIAAGDGARLRGWLDVAPGRAAVLALRRTFYAPSVLRAVLLRDPFNAVDARTLLEQTTADAAPVLLDLLADSQNRSARRMIFDHLRGFGASITPELSARLEAEQPWFVVRNLLALLRDVAPRAQEVMRFQDHPQPQVRIEALRLLADDSALRDAAIRRALDDRDAAVRDIAVDAAAALAAEAGVRLSPTMASRLTQLVDGGTLEAERAARAVRALGAARGPTTRDWCLRHVSRRGMLRRLTIADPSPTVNAALYLLARDYRNDTGVDEVIAKLASVRDARREAIEAGTRDGLTARRTTDDARGTS